MMRASGIVVLLSVCLLVTSVPVEKAAEPALTDCDRDSSQLGCEAKRADVVPATEAKMTSDATPTANGKQSLVVAPEKVFVESGTLKNLEVGKEKVIVTKVTNPVIIFGPVFETRETALERPAIVPRARLDKDTNTFYVTAAKAPCDGDPEPEDMDYIILTGNNQELHSIGGVKVAVFTADVQVGKEVEGQFPEAFTKGSSAMCIASIQSTNLAGYLQVNTERTKEDYKGKKDKKKNRPDEKFLITRIVGTMKNEVAPGVPESGSETVGYFCVESPGMYTPFWIKDEAKGVDFRVEVAKSIDGPGILNMTPGDEFSKMVVGGALNGGHPYHPRRWPTNNHVHTFFIQEDNCEHYRTLHMSERFLTLAFN